MVNTKQLLKCLLPTCIIIMHRQKDLHLICHPLIHKRKKNFFSFSLLFLNINGEKQKVSENLMKSYKAKQNIGRPFQTNNESVLELVKESVAQSQLSFSQVLHKFPILDFGSENPPT